MDQGLFLYSKFIANNNLFNQAVQGTQRIRRTSTRRMYVTMKNETATRKMVVIAMFSALSYVLMLVKFPIAYLGFLEFEFSDIPALVAGLTFGPISAVMIELIKNLIKLITNTTTGGVGEFANFLISSSFMLVSCGLYKCLKCRGKVFIGFSLGTIAMTIVGGLMNYFVLLPLYASFMGGMANIVNLAAKTIPAIDSSLKLVVFGISPFNIFKGIYISVIGYYLYKLLRSVLQHS